MGSKFACRQPLNGPHLHQELEQEVEVAATGLQAWGSAPASPSLHGEGEAVSSDTELGFKQTPTLA